MQDEAAVNRSISMTEPEWEMIEQYAKARGMSRSMAVRYLCLYSPHGLVTENTASIEAADTKERKAA